MARGGKKRRPTEKVQKVGVKKSTRLSLLLGKAGDVSRAQDEKTLIDYYIVSPETPSSVWTLPAGERGFLARISFLWTEIAKTPDGFMARTSDR